MFLKDPAILILDESTPALDAISERHIQRAIDAARRGRTVILVAHRPTTLLDAGRIFVFQLGKVQEEDPYHDLCGRGGFLAELVSSAESDINGASKPALAAAEA